VSTRTISDLAAFVTSTNAARSCSRSTSWSTIPLALVPIEVFDT
jgi:hypothetical protein